MHDLLKLRSILYLWTKRMLKNKRSERVMNSVGGPWEEDSVVQMKSNSSCKACSAYYIFRRR